MPIIQLQRFFLYIFINKIHLYDVPKSVKTHRILCRDDFENRNMCWIQFYVPNAANISQIHLTEGNNHSWWLRCAMLQLCAYFVQFFFFFCFRSLLCSMCVLQTFTVQTEIILGQSIHSNYNHHILVFTFWFFSSFLRGNIYIYLYVFIFSLSRIFLGFFSIFRLVQHHTDSMKCGVSKQLWCTNSFQYLKNIINLP